MSLRVVGEFLQHIPQESNDGAKSHIGDKCPDHSPSHNIAFSACDSCHKPLMLDLIVLAALRPSEAYEEHKGDFLLMIRTRLRNYVSPEPPTREKEYAGQSKMSFSHIY